MMLLALRPLSEYAFGQTDLGQVRSLVEDIDWDAPHITGDLRSLLLGIEAYIAGIDEGFNQEEDLRAYIAEETVMMWDLTGSNAPATVATANNAQSSPLVTVGS